MTFSKISVPLFLKRHFLKDDRAFSLLHQDFLRLWYYAPLVPVVKILKKSWGHRGNLGESGGQNVKGSDREKCQF